jgi:hypothetical protein
MTLLRMCVAGGIAAACLTVAAPAQAQSLRFTDPVGDTPGHGMDIVAATIRNGDRGVSTTVWFEQVMRGELIIGLRSHTGTTTVVSQHRPQRTDRSFLVTDEKSPCRGLRVDWDHAADKATVRVPSRCLDEGNYGALRAFVLTEDDRRSGDIDLAPESADREWHWTRRIPRG